MLHRLLQSLARHRTATLLLSAGLFVVAACTLPRLKLDDSPERWMPKSSVRAWEEFDAHFAHPDTIVVAEHFRGEVRDADVDYLAKLRDSFAAIPGVVRVIDVSRIAQDIERVPLTQMLKKPADPQNDPFAMYRGVLYDDPDLWRDSGASARRPHDRTAIMYLELDTGRKSVDAHRTQDEEQQRRRQIVSGVYRILDENARPDVTPHVLGAVVIQHELERIARRAFWLFVPASLLLALLSLGIGFRSLCSVLLAVTAVVWSATILLAGIVWAGWSLDVVTVGGPTLMFVIVIAVVVHFAHSDAAPNLTLEHVHPPPGEEPGVGAADIRADDETRQFVRWVAVPCLGAAVTTGVGFLMLAFNELAPTRELGVELFFGAVLAFFGVYLMRLWLPRGRPSRGTWLTPRRLTRAVRIITARPRTVIAASVVATAGLAAAAWQIETNADPFSFFHGDSRMARAFDHVRQRKLGMYLLDVALVPKDAAGEDSPAGLTSAQREAARAFQAKIERRPEVRNVVSTLDLRDYLDRKMSAPDAETVSKRDVQRALTFNETFANWMHDRTGEHTVRMTFKVDDRGEGFGDLMDDVRRQLPRDRFHGIVTGTAADVVVLAEGLIGGMTRGLVTAFLVMAAVCAFWFRSLRLTLIAFLPNVLPVLFILGVMGAFGVPLNSGSAMVATIALGVALNDTVHFIMHYRGRRLEGEPTERALHDTYVEIGRPIVLTSVVNCLGFSIFLLSEFRPMWDFGLLTGVTMFAALLGDLVLLPNLLLVFDRDGRVSNEEGE